MAVVAAHSFGGFVVPGSYAVELFFVISGFLISYVLVEVDAYSRKRDFWAARYLRLWPVYAVVAVATIVVSVVLRALTGSNLFLDTFAAVPAAAKAFLVFANATLIGQDWTLFMGVHDGHLAFTPDFHDSDVVLTFGLAVPPAWSLGVELTFYAIAPFVLRRWRWIVGLLVGSVAIRLALLVAGLATQDPWRYRFFPTELAFFLIGVLAHRLLQSRVGLLSERAVSIAAPIATAGFVALIAVWRLVPGPDAAKVWPYALLLAALLPLLLRFQKGRRWDRALGDLSYPLYIVHWLVIVSLKPVAAHFGVEFGTAPFFAIVLPSAIAGAWVLHRYVGEPVDRWRRRFREPAATREPAPQPLAVAD
jgi:peptidoglycan/LPS O-acetylase OafA/YrhL